MSPSELTCEGCGERNRIPPRAAHPPGCRRCHRPLPWLVDASDDDFTYVAGSAPIPVVIDFWGPWCAPSRRMDLVFDQLARALAGRAKLVKVNVEDTPQLIERFGVRGVPTVLVMHQGRAVARRSGAAQGYEFRDWVEEAVRCCVDVATSDR